MARTDFTQEIDGALADRNKGMRHWSEIARSGNGNMRSDLRDDLADYTEMAGIGEAIEEMTAADSALIDAKGSALAKPSAFRWPRNGETPPFAAKPGMVWLRKMTVTGDRKPGGKRLVRASWVQMSKLKIQQIKQTGDLQGLEGLSTGTVLSLGLGLAGGLAAWYFLLRKKK